MAALLKASRLLRRPGGEKGNENAAVNKGKPSKATGLFGGAADALSSALQNRVFEGFSAVSPDKTCVECYAFKSDGVG
jgi:hypothetical protein